MLSKKASLFLLSGIIAWILSFLFHEISNYVMWGSKYPKEIMDWIITLAYLLPPLAFIPLAVAGLKQDFRNRKTTGILITVANGLWLAYLLYSRVSFLATSEGYFGREETSLLSYFVFQWLGMLPVIASLLFGIALIGDNPDRLKRNAVWFVAGGLLYLFSHLGYCIQELVLSADAIRLETWQIVSTLAIWGTLLYPVGMIAAGMSTLKKLYAPHVPEPGDATLPAESQPPSPRVIDWFENYLLAAIPVAGPILLFAWGINHNNRIRRNWALTFFLALILRTLLNLIVFMPYVLFSDLRYKLDIDTDERDYLTVAWTAIFALIIAGAVLLVLHFNNKPDPNSDPGDPNPSIGTWISNFLILAVPVIGLICLVVWAIDNRNDIVRRWAAARLLWGGTMIVFSLYMYVWILEIIRLKSQFIHFQF